MRVEKLIIYGFGKHENVTVDFGPGITVLYGLNEAGKTTIQQFILHILFGFPQKNSMLLRYEPKSGGKYGGQVHLIDDTYGKCVIERVRGKSAGDVTVHFEDGTKGGEEGLYNLLRQYDRAAFESIFSFSLLQLQGFEKMDEEELSRTLLASGTTGVDSLLQLEKRMEKEMGDLFKKSGRNPEMNVKMVELKELELELKEEQGKVEEYAPSIKRLQEIEMHLIDLRAQEKALREESQQLTLMRQLLPLHQKKVALEAKLPQLNAKTFPADGIRRFESWSVKWTEAEAMKRRITEELADMTAQLPLQHEAARLPAIEILLAKEAEWHGWRMTITAAADELRHLTSLRSRLFGRLGVNEEQAEESLLLANVSIQKEEEMHNLIGGLTETDRQMGYSERQRVQLENDLIDSEKKMGLLEQSTPSQEELERLREWPKIRQQLAEAKAYVSLGRRPEAKNAAAMPAIILLVALVLIAFGFIQKEWFIVAVGVVAGLAGAFLFTKKQSQSDHSSKLQEMEQFITLHDGKAQQMEQLAEHSAMVKREKEELQKVYKSLEQKYHALEMELDALRDNRGQVESELRQFLRLYGFDELPSSGIIPELFRLIREVQEVAREMEEITNRKQMTQENILTRVADVEKSLQKTVPQEAMYEMLRREFMRLKEEMETIKFLKSGMDQKEAALKEVSGLASSLHDKLQGLLAEAGVVSEEEFYSAYDVYQEVSRLTEQLHDTNMQLSSQGTFELPIAATEEDLITKADANGTTRLAVDEKLNVLINEKAALIHKTDRLLSDETYGRKLQLFEMKKSELAELAKKWSERKAIAEAIRRTMTELKEKKLPEVLEVAEKLFHELTGGNYKSLNVTETGHFEVLSKDGMRYPIVELSQATKEQAYISLRLALATSILGTAPFPIMMDDPFVHFDGQRLSRMIELLDSLQNKHQFIYFTCHEVMKEQWQDATILNVSEIGNEQGAIVL